MRLRNVLGLSWANMRRRKTRTALTTLGIIVGIMAVVSISALSGGFETQINTQLTQGLDMDILTVLPGGGLFGGGGLTSFHVNDSLAIENITGVDGVLPVSQTGTQAFNEANDTLDTRLLGLNFTNLERVYGHKLEFIEGGMPDPSENASCIIGYLEEPIARVGENITTQILIRVGLGFAFQNITFTVAGLLDEAGSSGLLPLDRSIFIPLDTFQELFSTEGIDSMVIKIADPTQADTIADEISEYFEDQALVIVPSSLIETIMSVFDIIEVFLVAIASIALLVAGISILNIMLVSVMERTREIGIMKALGAKDRTILSQFLSEAVLLGIIGGIVGIGFGVVLAYGFGAMLPMLFSGFSDGFGGVVGDTGGGFGGFGEGSFTLTPILPLETILISIGFAVLVSIVFAWYPARKAAKLDPVKALRYE